MDIRHLLDQAKNLERAMADLEERLKSHVTEGSAGSGAVKVTIDGKGDVRELFLDPELVATGDAALVRDTILAALRQATEASRAFREQQKSELTGGLKLPEF